MPRPALDPPSGRRCLGLVGEQNSCGSLSHSCHRGRRGPPGRSCAQRRPRADLARTSRNPARRNETSSSQATAAAKDAEQGALRAVGAGLGGTLAGVIASGARNG